jgi:hypothetical protein
MQIDVTLLLSAINTVILVGAGIYYFKKNYYIIDAQSMEILSEAYEQMQAQEEASQELSEGEGFFKECLDEIEEDEDKDCKSKNAKRKHKNVEDYNIRLIN